jgi:hypothetical protein
VLFPDDLIALAQQGGDDREFVEEELRQLLLRVQRRLAGIDET